MMLAEQMRSPGETKRKILLGIFWENPDQSLRIPSISLEDTWSELTELKELFVKEGQTPPKTQRTTRKPEVNFHRESSDFITLYRTV